MSQSTPIEILDSAVASHLAKSAKAVVVLLGPTGVGKSSAAITLAKKYNGEIISADSRQIYQGMTIGTGAVTEEEAEGIPHHLVNVLEPSESYSAFDFKQQATAIAQDILDRGKVPFIVGGTGLYLNTLVYDYSLEDQEAFADLEKRAKIRATLEAQGEKLGEQAMHDKLRAVDPESADTIHPNNLRYVLRALEVYQLTGEKKSIRSRRSNDQFDFLLLGLTMDRAKLYHKIDRRHWAMFDQGLVKEVKALKAKGYNEQTLSMHTIGYEEVLAYLAGKMTLEECRVLVQQHARNYAKRQMTWFRKMPDVQWVTVE